MSVRPSSARYRLMPSCGIQVPRTSAITPPWKSEAAEPVVDSAAVRSPALATHCAAVTTSGTAMPATAVQRATAGRRRPSNHASSAAADGMMM